MDNNIEIYKPAIPGTEDSTLVKVRVPSVLQVKMDKIQEAAKRLGMGKLSYERILILLADNFLDKLAQEASDKANQFSNIKTVKNVG